MISAKELPKKRIVWDDTTAKPLLAWEGVHTVCEESRCPNRAECSAASVATFLIGGRHCTRACGFCHIETGRPEAMAHLREKETRDILEYARNTGLKTVVITSVARDDDEPGLAEHFAEITRELRAQDIDVELLIPDFHAKASLLDVVCESSPTVLAHNMETVKSLSKKVRPQAAYERSLDVFRYVRERYPDVILKSGFMTGLGETAEEIEQLLKDMKEAGIEIVTVGQYLRPSPEQLPVEKIYSLDDFREIETKIKELDFYAYEVGHFVRSSYMASRTMARVKQRKMERGES